MHPIQFIGLLIIFSLFRSARRHPIPSSAPSSVLQKQLISRSSQFSSSTLIRIRFRVRLLDRSLHKASVQIISESSLISVRLFNFNHNRRRHTLLLSQISPTRFRSGFDPTFSLRSTYSAYTLPEQVHWLIIVIRSLYLIIMVCASKFALSPVTSNQWIIDSGATHHIVSSSNLITNRSKINSYVALPSGAKAHISMQGSVTINNAVLQNVLRVPSFHAILCMLGEPLMIYIVR